MTRWEFEPGHTAAEFRARHMMVTWVRGHFKDVHGVVDLDFDNPTGSSFEAEIDATKLWTGTPISGARTSSTSGTTRGSPSRAPGSSRWGRCCTR
jgi:polyisoprenoid-binding protein YceI